jgi:hypothetical protein
MRSFKPLYSIGFQSYIFIIIIIIIIIITFNLNIYNYVPETNHVLRVYNVAAVLYLQFMVQVTFPKIMYYYYYYYCIA